MATSPPGSASAQKSDVMSGLEVRSPNPTKSTADLVDHVLARVREGEPDPAAKPASPAADAPAAKAVNPATFAAIEARKPPGPQAKPAPAPLKGPAAATPPKGPTADAAHAAATAAKVAAAKAAHAAKNPGAHNPAAEAFTPRTPNATKNPAAQPAPGKKPAAAGPEAATPPAAANAAPAGPPTASALIDDTAPWLPDESERKVAFLQVFRYWHAQVRPEYAHKARPAFLFLVTALPVMVKARDTLTALNLWEPPGEHSRQARDLHPSWKKYCEFLPRATQALQELDDYRHLSLLSALDDLNSRVIKAEKKFREGVPTGRR